MTSQESQAINKRELVNEVRNSDVIYTGGRVVIKNNRRLHILELHALHERGHPK